MVAGIDDLLSRGGVMVLWPLRYRTPGSTLRGLDRLPVMLG
jgi:hypothetical protein